MDDQQKSVVNLAEFGHNLLITGFPGTGKSHVLTLIVERMDYKKVVVTASTGKAAGVLREKIKQPVTTLHRFTAIMDGRFQDREILDLLLYNIAFEKQKQNITETEVLIIDEISMISRKILHQVEYLLRNLKTTTKVFGGAQVILSGDFYQLPPVPKHEYGDDGCLIINSHLMKYFHHINLTEIHRQDEPDLITAIHEIAKGEISTPSLQLLNRLKRNLPPGKEPVKLFAKNLDVDVYNAKRLLEMEGEEKIYPCEDEGDTKGIQAGEKLHLKVGCDVILTVNLSDELVNGLDGKVTELKSESVVCFFPSLNKQVEIMTYPFKKYDVSCRKDVGCRIQLPLRLGFAITVHKGQGMTLDRVSVNCKGMFQYGQIVVAISRAKKKKGLQVLNFSKNIVVKPPLIIDDFYKQLQLPVQNNLLCCVGSDFEISTALHLPVELECKYVENIYAENDIIDELGSDDEADLIKIIETVEKDTTHTATFPIPDDINVDSILSGFVYKTEYTSEQTAENLVVKYLKDSMEATQIFVQFLWDELWPLKEEYFPASKVENKTVTEFYRKFHNFISGEKYKVNLRKLLGHNPSSVEYNVLFKLSTRLRVAVLSLQARPVRQAAEEKAQRESVKQFMESEGGRGKIRYLAGWCVSKLKNSRKKKIMKNLYNKNVYLLEKWLLERDLIEHLESTEMELIEISSYKNTLQETARKQNIRKGLTNVSDSCYNFFMELNKICIQQQTEANLNLYGAHFYNYLTTQIENNESLIKTWENLFDSFGVKDSNRDVLKSLFLEVVNKYCMMSINQLRKDYLESKQTKKMEATRKQIRMRTHSEKAKQFNMISIKSDKTQNKEASHKRLQSEILTDNKFLETAFKKTELLTLSIAYDINEQKSLNKKTLSDNLKPVIMEQSHMLNTTVFEDIDENTERIQNETCPSESDTIQSARNVTETDQAPSTSNETSEDKKSSKQKRKVASASCELEESKETEKPSKKRTAVSSKGKGKKRKGKVPVKWPCGICGEGASYGSVGCDGCDTWYHGDCLKIENLEDLPDEWFCANCQADEAQ